MSRSQGDPPEGTRAARPRPRLSWIAAWCVLACCVGNAAALGRDDDGSEEGVALEAAAAELTLVHKGRRRSASALTDVLAPTQREALNEWAALASEHELTIVVPKTSTALVFGAAETGVLNHVAGVMDDAWELLQPLLDRDETDRAPRAPVAFLFDEEAGEEGAWPAVLEVLRKGRKITREEEALLGRAPQGVTIHAAPVFLQPTWDVVADDEFQLDNEVAHKFADVLLRERYGHLPENLRWGLGYVVEQRLYGSIYQFNATGFVYTADHFEWPRKTADFLDKARRKDGFRLLRLLADTAAAGSPAKPQLVTWGALDYLLHEEPEQLVVLLDDLAALHAEAARGKRPKTYLGDPEKAEAVLEQHLGELDAKDLAKHVKRLK